MEIEKLQALYMLLTEYRAEKYSPGTIEWHAAEEILFELFKQIWKPRAN